MTARLTRPRRTVSTAAARIGNRLTRVHTSLHFSHRKYSTEARLLDRTK
jgi:hypothetical protein